MPSASIGVRCARILSTVPALRQLHVHSIDLGAGASGMLFPALSSLRCGGLFAISQQSLALVAPRLELLVYVGTLAPDTCTSMSSHPTLCELHVAWIPALAPCLASLRKLHTLRLEAYDFSDQVLDWKALSAVRVLQLTQCQLHDGHPRCGDQFVQTLVTDLPMLAVLHLPLGTCITDASLVFIASICKRLHTLYLLRADCITPDGVMAVLNSTSLQTLHLAFCKQATRDTCAAVVQLHKSIAKQNHTTPAVFHFA